MAEVTGELPATPQEHLRYAGFVSRLIAFTVDLLILSVATSIVLALGQFLGQTLRVGQLTMQFIVVGSTVLNLTMVVAYYTVFWVLAGQTPGKSLMGVCVRANDGTMTFGKAIRRFVGYWISLPLFWGYLIVMVDDRRRAFHDRLAGTTVIYAPSGCRTDHSHDVSRPKEG